MGSNVGRDKVLCSVSTQVVKSVARVPVWVKLTPVTADIVEEAEATFLGGADAISSSNTFPSLPPIDPDTLDFEVNVDGFVSSGGLGGPAILPQSLAKMAQLTQAFPDREFSGLGGISSFDQALSYFLLGCGTVQVATAAMLDHAIGPNVIASLIDGMTAFLERNAGSRLDLARGLPRAASRAGRPPLADRPAGRFRATTAGTTMPPRRRATRSSRPRSELDAPSGERQPEVAHGEAAGGRLRGDEPPELGPPQSSRETVVVPEPVEHGAHPPREVLDPPDASQAAFRVCGEAALVARPLVEEDPVGQRLNIAHGEVEGLGPVAGTMWAASPAR